MGLILAMGALLALGTLSSELGGLHGDDARYILLAQSLATGQGYRSIYEPGSPLHTFNPPGFPLLLSPIVALWGARAFLAMHGMVVGWAILSLFLWRRWVREEAPPAVARATLLALATTPLWVEWCGQILSEMPYIGFSLMALLWVRRGGGLGITALLLLACYFTRSAGITLIVAVLGRMAWRGARRAASDRAGPRHDQAAPIQGREVSPREAVSLALYLLPPLLGWAVWCRWAGRGPEGSYPYLFRMVDPFQPELGPLTAGALLSRIIENGRFYVTMLGQVLVWPTTQMAPWISAAVGALAAGGVAAGLARRLRRGGSAAEWYFIAAAALILAWQGYEPRYLLPILPWIWLYLLEPLLRARWGRGILLACIAGNLAGSLWVVGLNAAGIRYHPGSLGFVAAHDWIRCSTPPEAVIMSRQYPTTALLAERRAVGFPLVLKEGQILATLRDCGVTHVLDDGFFPETRRYLVPVIRSHLDLFEPEIVRFGPARLLTVRQRRS